MVPGFYFKWKHLYKQWRVGNKGTEMMVKKCCYLWWPLICESLETRDSPELTGLLKSPVQSTGGFPTGPQEYNLSAKRSQFGLRRHHNLCTATSTLKRCERTWGSLSAEICKRESRLLFFLFVEYFHVFPDSQLWLNSWLMKIAIIIVTGQSY